MEQQELQRLKILKNIFPEDSWSWAITALRRNSAIWTEFENPDFSQTLIQDIGVEPQEWTPGRIGAVLLAKDIEEEIPFPIDSFDGLSAEIKGIVHQTYQEFEEKESETPDLVNGFLLALALLGEKGTGKSWAEILNQHRNRINWQTPLVILFNLVKDPAAYLRHLDPELALHVLLSNPSTPESLVDILVEVVAYLDIGDLEKWFKVIQKEVPDLVAQVAQALLSSLDLTSGSIQEILNLSFLNSLAGHDDKALKLLEKAADQNQKLHGKVTANLTKVKSHLDESRVSDQAWKDLKGSLSKDDLPEENLTEVADIINSLLLNKQYAAIGDLVEKLPNPLPEHPELLIALSEYALEQDQPIRGEQLALQALNLSLDKPRENLSSVLLKAGLYRESAQAAQLYLEKYPNHLVSHLNYVEALRSQGNYGDAAQSALILTVLFPQDLILQRKLAGYLEEADDWQEALEVRAAILTKQQTAIEQETTLNTSLPLNDLIAFANCAFSAKQYRRTVSACNQILAQDQENSPALSLKGKALCNLGQDEEGFAHLNRAVELTPEAEISWLTLAECQKGSGLDNQVRQTLTSGLTAASTQAMIYYQLGKIESDVTNHSRALEQFQKAFTAAESEAIDQRASYDIHLGISKSYYALGHHDQAGVNLKEINDRFPANFEANLLYGKLLLDTKNPRSALPYLIQVVDQDPDSADAFLYYADSLLQVGRDPQVATAALGKALSLDPENEIALVLLGDAQAASGDYNKSIISFQKARESRLMTDPSWSPRISAGLGKAALKLGETETALAALKDGHDRYPSDLHLTRSLARAYQAANLSANALETAKEAADIAPRDPDNLSWVASFTLELGSPEQGIASLKKLIRINPEDPGSYILLGKAQSSAGNQDEAANAFIMLSNFDDIQPEDLLLAGDALISLGKIEAGLTSLNKAISICEANPEPSPLLPKIWSRQAAGFALFDDQQKALELLDQAISAELDEPEWRIQKADLLIQGDRHQAAIASLSNALDLSPGQPALHKKMARVQNQIGASEEAFYHAQEALSEYQDSGSPIEDIEPALALAADLACGTLRTDTAVELLANLAAGSIPLGEKLSEDKINSLCLAAELALDLAQEVKAAEISNLLVSQHADHPRVSALQARILNRQGSLDEARTKYAAAVINWKNTAADERLFNTAMEIALGKTALEIQRWDEAAAHLQHAVDLSPYEKRALYELANGYVILAENRRFFESFKVIHNAPSQIAISSDVYQSFQSCLKALRKLEIEGSVIKKLEARGDAVFAPTQESAENLQALAETSQEKAALIAAFRHSRQKVFASQTALDHINGLGEDPILDAQIALALIKSKPNQAFKAASSALEGAKRTLQTQIPLYFVLQALSAKAVNDLLTAEESMGKALQIWDTEPRWYAMAAEMAFDYEKRVTLYQKAIELEPEYVGHYLALGKQQLNAKQGVTAVKSIDTALSLNPEYVDSWIQRALAKRTLHRMPEALASINEALTLAPEHKEARKTAALLTFENGNYRESERHLVTLLGQEPHDTELLGLFAKTLTAQRQTEEAMRVIDKAISLDEESLELKLQRASMIKQIEGPLAAIDELRIIGSHYPDQYPLIVELVATLAEAGEMDQAIRTAMDVLKNDEIGHTKEQKAHLYLTTGRLLRNTGQLDQAVHHLYKAKNLINPNYEAVLELGRVHHDRRQYNLALEQIQKAIDIEPEEAEGYYQAGKVLKDLKQYSQAEKMLRNASKLAPNDLKIHRQLGVLVTLNLVHGEKRQQVMA
ncbi:MAG TPA: tetratricopeptide repeat protein [Chloroflexi bacterium]|nr:tetratricopeptide repeat protein [Chloroflexota bacterium]